MFKGLGNLSSLVKQAQEMGGRLQSLNEELKKRRVVGRYAFPVSRSLRFAAPDPGVA